MKRKRRVIQDDFPTGELDRDALRRAFAELREKRLARERRAAASAADGSAPEPRPITA
jgi:hypothetical protein